MILDSLNHSKVWRSHPRPPPWDLESFDFQDQSVTPRGSHLSGESSLSCIPLSHRSFVLKQQLGREVNRNACGEDNGCSANSCFVLLPVVCSIASTLESHLDEKELPPLLGLEMLETVEIEMRHGADVWKTAVEFKRR